MVMPQRVLYDEAFYEQHKKEIDRAAETWGYARLAEDAAQLFWILGFIAFERVA